VPLALLSVFVAHIWSGYYKDEASFSAQVDQDATTFKPLGELVYSYTRPSRGAISKGKGTAVPDVAGEDDLVFEVYHVCFHFVTVKRVSDEMA